MLRLISAALASPLGTDAVIRWGSQREVVCVDRHTCTITASYIAKYATKATEAVTAGTLRAADQITWPA